MLSMMKDVGGIDMPEFFGKLVDDQPKDKANDVEGSDKPDKSGSNGGTAPKRK